MQVLYLLVSGEPYENLTIQTWDRDHEIIMSSKTESLEHFCNVFRNFIYSFGLNNI